MIWDIPKSCLFLESMGIMIGFEILDIPSVSNLTILKTHRINFRFGIIYLKPNHKPNVSMLIWNMHQIWSYSRLRYLNLGCWSHRTSRIRFGKSEIEILICKSCLAFELQQNHTHKLYILIKMYLLLNFTWEDLNISQFILVIM